MGTPWAPSYSHTTPIRIPKDMGSLYGSRLPEGGPIIGSPWNHYSLNFEGVQTDLGRESESHLEEEDHADYSP